MPHPFEMSSPSGLFAPDPTANTECPCPAPDDQYLLEVDAGAVFLTHRACGKRPRPWLDDAFSLPQTPVTLDWHDGRPKGPDDDDSSYGDFTVNDLAVVHDDVPYLVGRGYADREDAVWQITGDRDVYGRPLVFLLPQGAGDDIPLEQAVTDFGPLTLVPARCACEQHVDNESCVGPS